MYPTYGAENITDLVPTYLPEINHHTSYVSKHRPSIKNELNNKKFPAKTMGKAATTPPDAKKYLKKRPRHVAIRLNAAFNNKSGKSNFLKKTKPQVPRIKEMKKPVQPAFVNKIRENAIRNISTVPKLPKKIYVDSSSGHKNDLVTSGLVPRFRNKENYGQIPDYIKKRKTIVENASKAYDLFAYNQQKQDSLKLISSEEHATLLKSLKEKWSLLHHEYQGLSVLTDTAPKKNRKEKLENAMSEIERDVNYLERNATIYVEAV